MDAHDKKNERTSPSIEKQEADTVLRPHHLLCTQGYEGKGYDALFVENMTAITNLLRGKTDAIIQLVFSTDDLCRFCPKKIDDAMCEDNEKVLRIDKKLIDYFGLEEKNYAYHAIVAQINAMMTPSILDDICGDCTWYPVSACRKKILAKTMSDA